MKVLKNLLHKYVLSVIVIITFLSQSVYGQKELATYLQAGKEDASKLTQAYLSPVIVGASYGLNAAWFTTAKAHKSLGFDIGVYMSPVFIPKSRDSFTPDNLNLQAVSTQTPGEKSPTILGPADKITYKINNTPATFKGPEGLNLRNNLKVSGVVIPMVQVGIGIVKNTDLKVRYFPKTKIGDTKISILGFGVLHDIKQHIPGIKNLPFDLSVMAAFTNLKGTTDLSGQFQKSPGDNSAQQVEYNFNALLFQALISKKISLLTVYGGIGYSTTKSKSNVMGSYVVPIANNDVVLKDPINLNYKNNSLRVTAGFRIVLGVIFLSGDYTLQEYSSATVGLGVAFR